MSREGKDGRASPRVPVLMKGRVTLIDGKGYECTVCDLSRGGARLALGATAGVPERFWLTIGTSQTMREVTVVRRELTEVGVRFVETSA